MVRDWVCYHLRLVSWGVLRYENDGEVRRSFVVTRLWLASVRFFVLNGKYTAAVLTRDILGLGFFLYYGLICTFLSPGYRITPLELVADS